jgi:ankyrin repeat protein
MLFRKLSMLAAAGALCIVVGACGGADGASRDPVTAVDYTKFRLSFKEMYSLANPHLLARRVFYRKRSEGPDAAWFDAVKQGNLAQVKAMVAQGQNLEAKDEASLGQTALGWAAFIGYADMVRYLVEQGANIRATDRGDVYHSVKSAVLGGNVEVTQYLYGKLGNEVNWDAREDDGETLALVGAVLGRYEFLKWVLQFKPDLNVVSAKDASPLSGACLEGFYDVAQLLIENGAINHKTGKSTCE